MTSSVVGNRNIELKNVLVAVRKENEDLISLNKQILKHKEDKTDPMLMKLAECSGVVTNSEKFELERAEFSTQMEWITKRFKNFVSGIYQKIVERDRGQI